MTLLRFVLFVGLAIAAYIFASSYRDLKRYIEMREM
jgi:hypothetical protein